MDTRIIKIALAVASAAYTVYLFTRGDIWGGIGMIFTTALLVLMAWRSVRMIWVFFQLRQQKLDKARIWLDRINPEKLWKKQQGYYYFLDGSLHMHANQITAAEKSMKKALNLGLKMNHDKAAAKLNLSMIARAKNRTAESKRLMNEAKKLDTKGLLKKDIQAVEQAFKKPQKVQRQKYPRKF